MWDAEEVEERERWRIGGGGGEYPPTGNPPEIIRHLPEIRYPIATLLPNLVVKNLLGLVVGGDYASIPLIHFEIITLLTT